MLNSLVALLTTTTDNFFAAPAKTTQSGNMKDQESNNTMQLDLNYDKIITAGSCLSFEKFTHETFGLAHVDMSLLKSDEEKLTFFINAYNLLLLHALIMSGSLPQIEVTNIIFNRKVRYNIGGQLYSLQDIFNGILQCNQMKCLIYGKAFKKNDLRKNFIPAKTFPEVYFGLINMTKYSPKLKVYEPTTLLETLKDNTKDYFERYVQVLASSQDPTDLIEIALPSNLKQDQAEMKNFWKTDVTTVIKSVNNLSTASFNSSSQSLTSLSPEATRLSMDSSTSSTDSIKSVEAEKRKNVLNYLIENYHPELASSQIGERKHISKQTKFTFKQYQSNPPNWFTIFNAEFQQQIMDRYKVEIPASGEVLLAKQAKEHNCPIEAFFSKFSRTQKLMDNAKNSSTEPETKPIGKKRSSCVWKSKTFKKRDVSIVDFILRRTKEPPLFHH